MGARIGFCQVCVRPAEVWRARPLLKTMKDNINLDFFIERLITETLQDAVTFLAVSGDACAGHRQYLRRERLKNSHYCVFHSKVFARFLEEAGLDPDFLPGFRRKALFELKRGHIRKKYVQKKRGDKWRANILQ